MANSIIILPGFRREAKRLAKKYKSFATDLESLIGELKALAKAIETDSAD